MSDREFENYLALLTRLLRLGNSQRQQIAGELRAHLEDRLDELLSRGVSRDQAVRQALEEFGDAAGLAAEFVSLSRNRRRRWLMRMTTFSVAATVLLAAGLAIFWPGRNAGPGAATVVAQGTKSPSAKADPFAAPGGAPAANQAKEAVDPTAAPSTPAKATKEAKPTAASVLEQKLNQPTSLQFVEMPLRDVSTFLHDTTGIPFVLKIKKLDEASVSPETPITINLQGIRLSTALNLMLDELDLTFVEKEEVVLITTVDDAKATLEIRVYQCRDLLAMDAEVPLRGGGFAPGTTGEGGGFGLGGIAGGGGLANPAGGLAGTPPMPGGEAGSGFVLGYDERARRLMNLITTNVDQQSWTRELGGAGSISEYNGLIVVTQTAQTHKKIEHVLSMLREAAGLDPAKAGKVVR